MKLNYDYQLVNFEGGTFPFDHKNEEGKMVAGAMTLKDAIMTACKGALREDENMPWTEKLALGEIGQAVSKGLDLTTDQVSKIKERCIRMFATPELAYAINQAFENNQHPKAEPKKK